MTPDANWYHSLPRKRSAAGLVLRDASGRILLTKPPYRDYWQTVGGIVEDHESPRQAALREAQEEIGLVLSNVRLRVIDFMPDPQRIDSYQFMFDGGILSQDEIGMLRVDPEEVAEYGFFDRQDAEKLLGANQRRRLSFLWDTFNEHTVFYLENGERA